jgi:hypothetical protein
MAAGTSCLPEDPLMLEIPDRHRIASPSFALLGRAGLAPDKDGSRRQCRIRHLWPGAGSRIDSAIKRSISYARRHCPFDDFA